MTYISNSPPTSPDSISYMRECEVRSTYHLLTHHQRNQQSETWSRPSLMNRRKYPLPVPKTPPTAPSSSIRIAVPYSGKPTSPAKTIPLRLYLPRWTTSRLTEMRRDLQRIRKTTSVPHSKSNGYQHVAFPSAAQEASKIRGTGIGTSRLLGTVRSWRLMLAFGC